jgi:hypothetical protein
MRWVFVPLVRLPSAVTQTCDESPGLMLLGGKVFAYADTVVSFFLRDVRTGYRRPDLRTMRVPERPASASRCGARFLAAEVFNVLRRK